MAMMQIRTFLSTPPYVCYYYRFHAALIDHLLQYQYNVTGAYQLIQDIHKYKETVQHFKVCEY